MLAGNASEWFRVSGKRPEVAITPRVARKVRRERERERERERARDGSICRDR